MAMIEVRDLTKFYGSFRALAGVDFRVDKGEILGFLGPNGAGKTTTMKILTGFLHPTGGSAEVAGLDILKDSLQVRRKIGYLPEHTPLYDDMTVAEYLRHCGKLRGMGSAWRRERIEKVIGLTSLEPKRKAPIKTLSKGYRQRVGIAQAILHEPEIVILDEPTVGLDPNQVLDARRLIGELGRERTVILCSHILSEVEAICGRVIIINRGRIVADGTPAHLAESLSGRTRQHLVVLGTAPALREALGEIQGLSIQRSEDLAEGRAAAWFTLESPLKDVAKDLGAALATRGLATLAAAQERASLEDVFRAKTAEED